MRTTIPVIGLSLAVSVAAAPHFQGSFTAPQHHQQNEAPKAMEGVPPIAPPVNGNGPASQGSHQPDHSKVGGVTLTAFHGIAFGGPLPTQGGAQKGGCQQKGPPHGCSPQSVAQSSQSAHAVPVPTQGSAHKGGCQQSEPPHGCSPQSISQSSQSIHVVPFPLPTQGSAHKDDCHQNGPPHGCPPQSVAQSSLPPLPPVPTSQPIPWAATQKQKPTPTSTSTLTVIETLILTTTSTMPIAAPPSPTQHEGSHGGESCYCPNGAPKDMASHGGPPKGMQSSASHGGPSEGGPQQQHHAPSPCVCPHDHGNQQKPSTTIITMTPVPFVFQSSQPSQTSCQSAPPTQSGIPIEACTGSLPNHGPSLKNGHVSKERLLPATESELPQHLHDMTAHDLATRGLAARDNAAPSLTIPDNLKDIGTLLESELKETVANLLTSVNVNDVMAKIVDLFQDLSDDDGGDVAAQLGEKIPEFVEGLKDLLSFEKLQEGKQYADDIFNEGYGIEEVTSWAAEQAGMLMSQEGELKGELMNVVGGLMG
ncbi:hypothetical protein EG328_008339 [Venturia inaequalis]|uniref:Uncharacterized protein n=1 Tax=Venturia inaequalis TaxID=5025 RepID=A0A8H3V7N0_VENIN|nr:hypothetical protein EG328_008339 [Venturia inaequalis]